MKKLTIEIEQTEDGDNIVSSPIITRVYVNNKPVAAIRSLTLCIYGDTVDVRAKFDEDAAMIEYARRLSSLPFVQVSIDLGVDTEEVVSSEVVQTDGEVPDAIERAKAALGVHD